MRPDNPRPGVARGPGPATTWTSAVALQRSDEGLGSLAEALDRILCKGVAVDGAVTIGVAGVELILLDLRLLLAAIDTVRPDGSFFSGPSPARDAAGPSGPRVAPPPARSKMNGAGSTSPGVAPAPGEAAPCDQPPAHSAPQQGLVRLVLTLVNLLHEILERQAVRRMDNGTLTPGQTEDIGFALQAQATEIARLRAQFGLTDTDLTLRLSATG